jgi:hypothetical protein
MVGEGGGDLACGDHEPAGGMQDDLDRPVGRRLPDRPEDALRVVDVDVADEREAQERHRLLPVDQRDGGAAALLRDCLERAPALHHQRVALRRRLERREDEDAARAS